MEHEFRRRAIHKEVLEEVHTVLGDTVLVNKGCIGAAARDRHVVLRR